MKLSGMPLATKNVKTSAEVEISDWGNVWLPKNRVGFWQEELKRVNALNKKKKCFEN